MIAQQLRGGGAMDQITIAKVGMTVQAVASAPMLLAPAKNVEWYGGNFRPSEALTNLVEGMGISNFRTALMAYLSIVKGDSVHRVIGIGTIPHLVWSVKYLLNGKAENLPAMLFDMALAVLTMYSCLTDNTSYADTVIYVYLAWGLLNALGMFFMPAKLLEKWQPESVGGGAMMIDSSIEYGVKSTGANVLMVCALMLALMQGQSGLQAFGYAMAVSTAGMLSAMFITKEIDDLGLAKGPLYFYIVVGAIIAGTLIL